MQFYYHELLHVLRKFSEVMIESLVQKDTSVLQEAADSFLYPLIKVQEYKWEVE